MLKADTAPYFHSCPRCGVGGLERLPGHAFCVNCNYSPDLDYIKNSKAMDDERATFMWIKKMLAWKPSPTNDLSLEQWAELERKKSQYNKSTPDQHLHIRRDRLVG